MKTVRDLRDNRPEVREIIKDIYIFQQPAAYVDKHIFSWRCKLLGDLF